MNIVLERKQPLKIVLLRLLFIAMTLLIIGLIINGLNDYATVTCLLFSGLLIPSVSEFTLFQKQIHVNRYFLLGMLKRSSEINLSDLELNSFEVVVDETAESGTLMDIFISGPYTTVKYFTLKYKQNEVNKKLTIRLSDEDYTCISYLAKKNKE